MPGASSATAPGAGRDDLKRQVARILGWHCHTKALDELLDSALPTTWATAPPAVAEGVVPVPIGGASTAHPKGDGQLADR